jgi:hypothetical protein
MTIGFAQVGNRFMVMKIIPISATMRDDITVKAIFELVDDAILNENSF